MPDVTPDQAKSGIKRFFIRALLWLFVTVIIYSASEWVQTAYWPTVSTSVAMGQMENSDAAFIQMQTAEQVKNSFSMITVLLIFIWTVAIWLDYVVRGGFKAKALLEEDAA
jgi:hypothetical protein